MRFEAMGKSYDLKYDFNAICAIEELAGVGFDELIANKKGVHTSIRYMLWGGLLKFNRDITVTKVGEIIEDLRKNGKDFADIVKMIFDALVKSGFITEPKQENENETEVDSLGEHQPEREST